MKRTALTIALILCCVLVTVVVVAEVQQWRRLNDPVAERQRVSKANVYEVYLARRIGSLEELVSSARFSKRLAAMQPSSHIYLSADADRWDKCEEHAKEVAVFVVLQLPQGTTMWYATFDGHVSWRAVSWPDSRLMNGFTPFTMGK